MNKDEFIQELSIIKSATSVTGKKYNSIHINGDHIKFIRENKSQYERILIDELFDLFTKENNFNTTIAKSYISGRVQSPALAILNQIKSGSFIRKPDINASSSQNPTKIVNIELSEITKNRELLMKVLMNEKNFKNSADVDKILPNSPGLYCIRIRDINALPNPFNTILKNRQHNIIYIGIASKSLNKRFINQELRAKGHGTFFRSIGAVLGFRPPKGSLKNKANKKNYKFLSSDESKIIEWINCNLIVNWIEYKGDFESIENYLIQKFLPLFNLAKNTSALKELSLLRAECVKIANT